MATPSDTAYTRKRKEKKEKINVENGKKEKKERKKENRGVLNCGRMHGCMDIQGPI
jgi:hypothetical protein